MIKNEGIIIENLKKKDLNDFSLFVKKFFNFKILIDNKYYKSSIFNSVFLKYQFWNKNNSNYNFKIIRDNKKKIILIHGYIPISKYDKQLDDKTIFLSLLIGSNKVNFPLFPISYSAITNMDKANFVYSINPSFTPFMRYKKFEINKMNHHFSFSNKRKKFYISNIKNIKSRLKNLNNSTFNILNEKYINKLNSKSLFSDYLPHKSINYLINRYMKHPIYKYFLYGCFDKNLKLKIILVTRELIYKNLKAVRIVEIVGKNKDIIFTNGLLNNLSKNYEFVDLYSYGIDDSILKDVGFNNTQDHPKIIIPDYFEPYKKANNDLYCAFKNNFSQKKVRFFKGDGDQDNPRVIFKN